MTGLATTKRGFLGLLGTTVGGVALTASCVSSQTSYSNTVDIVQAGADETGSVPINDVLESVVGDDTLVEFPPGTYLMEREFAYDDARNVGLVGTGGSSETTLLVEDTFQDKNIFDFGTTGSFAADGITFSGFTVDMSMPGAGAGVFWAYCLDGCHVEDIVVDGVIQGELPSGKGEVLMRVDVMNSDGTGLIKDVSAVDGAEWFGSGDPATGIYIGGAHAGRVVVENCEVSGFQDNGLYTSAASQAGGEVIIQGGHYFNNDISNVRVGGADTLVENVTITQDSTSGYIHDNPRGIYGRNGNAVIRDVDINYHEGASEAIQCGVEMESVDIQNVRIHQTTDEVSVRFREGALSDESFSIDGLTVVAEGEGRPLIDSEGWSGTITNACLQTTDSVERDGILVRNESVSVADSNANVSGEPISGATSDTNISFDGECSLSSDPVLAVSTLDAANTGESSATLNGTLDDLGGASSVDLRFEYRVAGTDTWETSSSQTLTATGSFSDDIGGLTGGTAYEFRAAADASDGDTDTGSIVTFTSDSSLTVVTEAATNVQATSLTANGTLEALGGATAADVRFDYREAEQSSWDATSAQTLSSPGSFSADVSGLAGSTAYECRAVAVGADGSTVTGSTVTATTSESTSQTPTSTPTDTPTSTPTDTPTSTPTDTPTSTPAPSSSSSESSFSAVSSSSTPSPTATASPTPTPTASATSTAAREPSVSLSGSARRTPTPRAARPTPAGRPALPLSDIERLPRPLFDQIGRFLSLLKRSLYAIFG